MSDATRQRARFEEVFKKPVVVEFSGEQRSSDGGAVLLGAVDRRIGLTSRLIEVLEDRRDGRRIEHDVGELFRQRVFAIALGYSDQNDSARIGSDPVLKMLCGRSASSPSSLASQPTLSRFGGSRSGRELVALGRTLERFVIARLKKRHAHARRITIDLDSTEIPRTASNPSASSTATTTPGATCRCLASSRWTTSPRSTSSTRGCGRGRRATRAGPRRS